MSDPANQIETALTAAVISTMENLAFEEVDPADPAGEAAELAEETLWVFLEIISPWPGQVMIELSPAYAEVIVRALYGQSEDKIPHEVVRDALGELSNTLAGRFMAELLGPGRDYDLGFPLLGQGRSPILEVPAADLFFMGSGGVLRVAVRGNEFRNLSLGINQTVEGVL